MRLCVMWTHMTVHVKVTWFVHVKFMRPFHANLSYKNTVYNNPLARVGILVRESWWSQNHACVFFPPTEALYTVFTSIVKSALFVEIIKILCNLLRTLFFLNWESILPCSFAPLLTSNLFSTVEWKLFCRDHVG